MNNEQYYPDDFFSYELVERIMKEFVWPKPYELIDEDLSVEIKFPKCIIEISSNGLGDTEVSFLTYNGNKELNVNISDILWTRNLKASDLDLEDSNNVWPNLEDTKKSIRNSLKILQGYFLPFIKGEDYTWVDAAKKEKKSE